MKSWEKTLTKLGFIILTITLIAIMNCSLFVGNYEISVEEYLMFLNQFLGLKSNLSIEKYEMLQSVIFDIRLPRIIAAVIIGATLSISGAAFQAMFVNPLVSPGILGVLSGASFGAALGMVLGWNWFFINLSTFIFGAHPIILHSQFSTLNSQLLMKRPSFLPVLIGTGFGSGFSPFAPGTAGALLASIIWIALYFLLPFSWVLWLTAALVIVFTFAGIWAADKLETYWGEDPSRVVVDEMVGVWIPLLAVPNDDKWFWYVIAAFALFRIFDIAKPLGIRRMESLKGGVGVMMDDVLAGVYSFILLVGARWVIG